MKNFFFLLVTLSFFISCNNSIDYKGKWRLDLLKLSNNEIDYPTNIFIENDSIKFNYWAFNHNHKFLLKIENKKLLFGDWEVNYSKIVDTIIINENSYVKDQNDSIFNWWWDKPITEIKLPKIKSNYFVYDKIDYKNPIYYILFGKPYGKNKYKLQLNDKHAEVFELMFFINSERLSVRDELAPYPTVLLNIDNTTPMKFTEDIFYNLKKVNQLKISLVNNINLNYNYSLGLHYMY